MSKTFVVAVTGASGVVYARRLTELLLLGGHEVHWTVSQSGADVWRQEFDETLNPLDINPADIVPQLDASQLGGLHCHRYNDYFSPIASGSFKTDGMVVCPCSGQTLAAIAHSMAGNLIQRAAEVHLKEHRKLVLVTRETPISSGQIENMALAARHGSVILPASPGWYHGVQSLNDLIDFIVSRILDQLDVDNELMQRWGADANR